MQPATRITSGVLAATLVAATAAALTAAAAPTPPRPPPIFTPNPSAGWFIPSREWLAPESGPGPVMQHPNHPLVSNDDYRLTGKQPTFPVGDPDNPILLPWAKERIARRNAIVLAGKPAWSLHATCRPMGLPAVLLVPMTRPMFVVQGRDKVLMIQSSFADVRRIHLNAAHARDAKPSWHGDSVGHYEGDTLVVDTIGLNDKAPVDGFDTPHTEELRVVERWRLTDGGETLEVKLYIEDKGAFTTPWTAIARYSRTEGIARRTEVQSVSILSSPGEGPLLEAICAENPNSIAGADAPPVVQSTVPDF
jgi:hypothetical protein